MSYRRPPKPLHVIAFLLEKKTGEEPAPEVAMTAFLAQKAECQRCGKEGLIGADFGTKPDRGDTVAQSWCIACRRTPKTPVKKTYKS